MLKPRPICLCEHTPLFHRVEDRHKLSENFQYQLKFLLKCSWSLSFPTFQAYLEQQKLFHGDIAARNVLLHRNFTAKLCGLGLAYETYTYGANSVTQVAPVKWQAPEQLLKKPPSIKADMYDLIFGLEVHLSVRPIFFTPPFIISCPEVHCKAYLVSA